MKPVILVIALAVVLFPACALLTPPAPSPDDYPCTVRGHSCGNGMCCWNHEACIAGGLCENTGNDLQFGASPAHHPQFEERRR